jgi:dienelactone hydrolase
MGCISSIAPGNPRRVETVEYTSGRRADLYGDDAARTVLMWHGAQTDARATMRRLAERVAEHGLGVVVPDWNSHADDSGRADLLRSLEFTRRRSTDGLVLVGWSLGGVAAAGVTVHARRLGVRLAHTVCLAGAFMVRDPISGEPLPTDLAGYSDRSPFTLLHGVTDDVIPVAVSQAFAATLAAARWPVALAEVTADHGSIAGATYDSVNDRYFAADDPRTLAVAADVASRIALASVPS